MVLYPDYASISDLIQRAFYPQVQMSLAEIKLRADAEAAPIYVFNGTQLFGLASATREWLITKSVLVAGIHNDTANDRELTENPRLWRRAYLDSALPGAVDGDPG